MCFITLLAACSGTSPCAGQGSSAILHQGLWRGVRNNENRIKSTTEEQDENIVMFFRRQRLTIFNI